MSLVSDYKSVNFSRDLVLLYANRVVILSGTYILGIFLPIFFYKEFGNSVLAVALIYGLLFSLHAIFTPISAKFINIFGMKPMIIAAIVPCMIMALSSLFFFDVHPIISVAVFIFGWALYRALYWLPYNIDFAEFTDKVTRGRQLSIMGNISDIVLIVSPIVGGFVILNYGFNTAFAISLTLYALSVIPILFIDNSKERYSYSFFGSFKEIFSKEKRPMLLGHGGNGAQAVVALVFWPIFLLGLLNGEYLKIGALSAAVVLVTMSLRFVTGSLIDKWSSKRVVQISSIVYMTGWLLKIFAETAVQVFLFDTYHSVSKAANRVSINAATYDNAADNGHYIDEFTALREIALNIGRITMLVLVSVFSIYFGIKVAFFFAALASLFMFLISKHTEVGHAHTH